MNLLIRNAAAILTGLPGPAARHAGPDIRVREGKIAALGQAANIAIYALDRDPRYFGLHDLAIGPVASGGSAHLKALLIGGREIVRNGVLPGLDLLELSRPVRAAVARLANASR